MIAQNKSQIHFIFLFFEIQKSKVQLIRRTVEELLVVIKAIKI
jgi:hypothetical protein